MVGRELKTRADFEKLALELLNPLIPHYSKEGARLYLGANRAVYEQEAAWAEAFLRPLWGLVPMWAGGSHNPQFEAIYQRGLTAGTDPKGEEYWGGFHDVDQRFVEMAALSYGLLMAPEVLWEPLSKEAQGNAAAWLSGMNQYECPPCNWMFFGILVNIALKSKNRGEFDKKRLEEYLDYIESCYEGNGWYIDGQNGEKDYYVSFAFHYYSLIYIRFMRDEDPGRCREYEERARIFAEDFVYWFEDDGAALAYGRSLTYRMAQVSFFSMCATCELEVLPFPVMKGIIARHFKFWMKQPVFDNGGILTIGYGYPNLLMSEQYNAPGSPYWCMKSFALLSLPEDHWFWKLQEAPLTGLSSARLISNGSMLIQRLHGRVNAFVCGRTLPHQHVLTEEKYSKFVYSSRFAFSVPRSFHTLEETAADSVLAVISNGMVYTKGITKNWVSGEDFISMEWSPCHGIRIFTELKLLSNGHKRTHIIESAMEAAACDCGFALPDTEGKEERTGECFAEVLFEGESYFVINKDGKGTGRLIHPSPNTNLMHPKTVIPAMEYRIEKGRQTVVTEFLELEAGNL